MLLKDILPKKCSHYEIKILNSKKYNEQLNLTRSSIKKKLFEITKENKESKFQQDLCYSTSALSN